MTEPNTPEPGYDDTADSPDPEQRDESAAPAERDEPDTADADPTAESDTDPALRKARRDAANYRERLRATETERDTLADQLDTTRTALAESYIRAAGTGLEDPADVWRAGTSLADVTTDDGAIDPEKITTVLQDLQRRKPAWFRSPPPVTRKPVEQLSGGLNPEHNPAQPTWAGLLQRSTGTGDNTEP